MKIRLISLVAGALVLQACGSAPTYQPKVKPTYKGIHPLVVVKEENKNSERAVITINGTDYHLPAPCSLTRQFGDIADSRQFGDQADSRQFGDDADSRQFGDDADSRQFGDDADSRQFGDDADSRQFGDDADSRQFGDDADSRQFGDDADSRQFGDDADSRQFGDMADARQFGDDAENRQFGGQSNQFKCIKVTSINAVVVTGLVGHEVVTVDTGNEFLNYKQSSDNLILKY